MPKVEIIKQKGYNFLWINDYLWMWDIPVEQEAQQLICDQSYGEVLVAGYGLGILQRQLVNNPNVSSVTTIEIFPEVIEANKQEYGEIHGDVIIGDFYQLNGGQKYDCVIGDIWEDIAETALVKYNQFEDHASKLVKDNGKILGWGQRFFHALNFLDKHEAAR